MLMLQSPGGARPRVLMTKLVPPSRRGPEGLRAAAILLLLATNVCYARSDWAYMEALTTFQFVPPPTSHGTGEERPPEAAMEPALLRLVWA